MTEPNPYDRLRDAASPKPSTTPPFTERLSTDAEAYALSNPDRATTALAVVAEEPVTTPAPDDPSVQVPLSTLVHLTSKRDEARARVEHLEEQRDDLAEQRDEAVKRVITLSAELRDARAEIDALRHQLSETTSELNYLRPHARIVPPPVYGQAREPNVLVTCGEKTGWSDRPCTLLPGHPGQHVPVVYNTAKVGPHTHVYDGNGDCHVCGQHQAETNFLGWPNQPWSISLGRNGLPAVKVAVRHAGLHPDHDPRVFLGTDTDAPDGGAQQTARWECPDCPQSATLE